MTDLTFMYADTAGIDADALEDARRSLDDYRGRLSEIARDEVFDVPEASINVPFNTAMYRTVLEESEQKNTESLQYIIVVGIGGSHLGTKAVYEAVFGMFDPYLTERIPKFLFADTTDTRQMREIKKVLSGVQDASEVMINVVSKSGTTTETIANAEVVYETLSERFGTDILERMVVTTDEGSALWQQAEEKGVTRLPIPKKVGGRYSVFTPVGLFPLILAGIDVRALLRGARDMRDQCLAEGEENHALTSAALMYLHRQNGIRISNHFFFDPAFASVGAWYRQLMGESIGKEHSAKGEEVHEGITPIISIGSTDLHSMAQLYYGGPRDKFTTIVSVPPTRGEAITVPETPLFSDMVDGIYGRSFTEIMNAIRGGVKAAYQKDAIPFAEITLPGADAFSVGAFLQMKMMEMMYLAQLLGVNAFDQPNVEGYKEETRQLLDRS